MNSSRVVNLAVLCLIVSCVSAPAYPANKDMVELQTKVQALLDAVARLQQSNDERMGVIKDLVQQNSDSVNRMSVSVTTLEKQVSTQQLSQGGKVDQVSGQIQALNDSLDEIKARMNRLDRAVGEVSSQQQNLAQTLQSAPAPAAASSAGPVGAQSSVAVQPLTQQAAATPPPALPTPAPRKPSPATLPLVDDLYKAAFNDFMAARYAVASAEFGDVIKGYPDSQLSGNAWYYQGEIDYRAAKYATAAKDYDKLLEQYPDNNKIPAAHLHKGQALIELKQNDAGVREFRTLIQRFPNSPEAGQARSKLNAMGVPIKPRG